MSDASRPLDDRISRLEEGLLAQEDRLPVLCINAWEHRGHDKLGPVTRRALITRLLFSKGAATTVSAVAIAALFFSCEANNVARTQNGLTKETIERQEELHALQVLAAGVDRLTEEHNALMSVATRDCVVMGWLGKDCSGDGPAPLEAHERVVWLQQFVGWMEVAFLAESPQELAHRRRGKALSAHEAFRLETLKSAALDYARLPKFCEVFRAEFASSEDVKRWHSDAFLCFAIRDECKPNDSQYLRTSENCSAMPVAARSWSPNIRTVSEIEERVTHFRNVGGF